MESKKNNLKKESNEYFSKIQAIVQENTRQLESEVYRIEDENQYAGVSINGRQQLLSLDISDTLLCRKNKEGTIQFLIEMINRAIKMSKVKGLMNMINLINPKEFAEIISSEREEVKNGVEKIKEDINKLNSQLRQERRSAISRSGRVRIEMTGVGLLQSIEIFDEHISTHNKEMIGRELLETINSLSKENLDKITESVGKTASEFDALVV